MRWPNDRKFVDALGKILDHWLGPLKRLEPFLDFSTEEVAALKELAQEQEEVDEGGEETDIFDFPIDEEPLFSEDHLIERKANGDMRLVAMTHFVPTLISTTELTGLEVDIALPSGYANFDLHIRTMIPDTTRTPQVRFSSDGGGSFINCTYGAFGFFSNDAGAAVSIVSLRAGGIGATGNFSGTIRIVGNPTNNHKFAQTTFTHESATDIKVGCIKIEATAPINLVRIQLDAGSFASGAVDLWAA